MTLKRPTTHYLAAIFLAAILLRLPWLGMKSLWLDEALSLQLATPVMADVDFIHPPLYYVIVHYATSLLGRSAFALRLPSALFSLVSVGLVYLLGARLLNRQTGLLAAALLAVSPLDIWYAQEGRNYALVACMTLLMSVGLAWRHWAGYFLYFVGLLAGLHLHYIFAPIWLAISAIWLVTWRQREGRVLHLMLWLAATGVAWWVFRPWAPALFEGRWLALPVRSLFGVSELSGPHFGAGSVAIVAGSAILALAGPRLLPEWRWRRLVMAVTLALFVGCALFVPIPRAYALKRATYTVWALLVLLVAWLILNLPKHRKWVAASLLSLSLASSLVTVFLVPKDDWRAVAQTMKAQAPDAVVWLDPSWNNIAYRYYDLERQVLYGDVAELEDTMAEHGELWLVAERFHGRPIPSSPSEAWLDANVTLLEVIPFYRLELRRYELGS
jgi:mannosyltransferase